ncbi:MAG: carboxypeptidase-like regulatory domain-containing protein, partial [Cyclobacteriaceae bacterium]|nr:carboxypeptidase-like regulatory domain-containing protein [Cyclobacteriaceae bacterium]
MTFSNLNFIFRSINSIFIKRSEKTYRRRIALLLYFILAGTCLYAQNLTEISGHIVDDSNNLPLEFVNVYFRGSIEGTVTDTEGNFSLKTFDKFDSLTISIVGYDRLVIPIKYGEKQDVAIGLKKQLVNLDEVIVMSGENPAWAIIREAVKNKKQHDKRALDAYEYQSYNRIEFDIDNISTKL